jgi:PAS domain S-box-containing protein
MTEDAYERSSQNTGWWGERRLIVIGFVVAAAVMLFVGWESYRDTVRVADAAAARRHSYEVRAALADTAARLVDAETGQRGFLLTGNESYLEPFRQAVGQVEQLLAQLKTLTVDNTNQQMRIQQLEPVVDKKLAELQLTIELRRQKGSAAANEVVNGGEGKMWMDQIRVILADMQGEEDRIRAIRSLEMTNALKRNSGIVVGGNLLSALLLLAVFVLLFRALSERKRAQKGLEKSEKWLSTTLASIGDAVIATDMNGAVSFMNPVAQSLTGWSLQDARGKSMDLVFDIVNKETRRPVENPVKKVFREGKVVGLADHTILLSKSGKEFDIEDSAAPILTDTGAGLGVVLVFRDITDKKLAEEETRRQKDLLQLILASVADGVVVADTNGKFLLFNQAAERFIGLGAIDASPERWSKQYGAFRADGVTPFPSDELPLVRAMRGENVNAVELFIRNANVPDGRLLSITGRPLRGQDGALKGGVVALQDITLQKQAAEALRQSEERYHLLFDSNPHPVWVYDLKTLAILDVNPSAVQNYGYSREEFLSLTIKDIRPPEDVPALLDSAAKAMPGTETAGVWKHRKKDGSLIHVEITSRPLVYDGRDARLVVATDVSVRKRAEEALVRAKEEAERTSQFKDQFLSTMSHELRTPLNAVLGFSDLLADERYGPLNEKQRRYVDHIHTGGKHLLTLISDILDLSKIEAGRMELALETLSVQDVFSEVISVMQPLADRKSHGLTSSCDPGLAVRADATRLKQVLMNLLGNAIKFTSNGGRVELIARLRDGKIRMEVRDNGPGIPMEEQKRIFEAFYRLRESGKKTEGTGLGLAITQRLVELHGGELNLDSQPGGGSCFYFTLPAHASARESVAREEPVALRPAGPSRILVIEDDRVTAHLIQTQLTSSGYHVVLCEEPQSALEIAAQLQPSAITLDIVMKPKNGWEVLTQLKRDPRTARIPMIVVSIVDQPGMGTLLGADDYLVKPVDKDTLLRAIARHIGVRSAAKSAKPILVVEDDTPTREFIAEMLSSHGYAVSTAADGAEARARVAASLPELVILDMLLPEVSGFELLSEWRASMRTATLPIFVLTSKDLNREEQNYLRTHTEALLRKQEPWQDALIKQLERVGASRSSEKR